MKIDPKKMQAMLKQMGMQQENIVASRVIIERSDGNIVIENPSIQKIKLHGEESFQITGNVTEQNEKFTEEDIKLVSEKTGKTYEEAKNALQEKNDIAEAIMSLT